MEISGVVMIHGLQQDAFDALDGTDKVIVGSHQPSGPIDDPRHDIPAGGTQFSQILD
jgi:hypothetical protein